MDDAEEICGCVACAALCGVCCVAAAEEDKRERERAAAEEAQRLKNPEVIQVDPVAVAMPPSEQQKLKQQQGSVQKDILEDGVSKAEQPKKKKKKTKKTKKRAIDGSTRKRKTDGKHSDDAPSY